MTTPPGMTPIKNGPAPDHNDHDTSIPPPPPATTPYIDGTVPRPKPTNGNVNLAKLANPNDVPKNNATTPPGPVPTKGRDGVAILPSPLSTNPKGPAPADNGSNGTVPKVPPPPTTIRALTLMDCPHQ